MPNIFERVVALRGAAAARARAHLSSNACSDRDRGVSCRGAAAARARAHLSGAEAGGQRAGGGGGGSSEGGSSVYEHVRVLASGAGGETPQTQSEPVLVLSPYDAQA